MWSYEKTMIKILIVGLVNKTGYQHIWSSILEKCSNDKILRYFGSLITLDMIFNNRTQIERIFQRKGR